MIARARAPSVAGAAVAPRPLARDPERFELKYWVPEAVTEKVIRHARAYVEPDLQDKHPDPRGQCNTSLYLETPDWACFDSHLESSPDRFKLRVRAYGDPPSSDAFFETKRKLKSVTVKTRSRVPLALVTPLLEGRYDALPRLDEVARRSLEGFLYLQMVSHAEPRVLVRAFRAAYATPDPVEDIRVTFDRGICFQPARGASFDADPNGWIPIDGRTQNDQPGPHALLELKFPRIAPSWMRALTRRLEMWRVAYSKYMWAVQTLREQPLLDLELRNSQASGGA